jgi:hypothetical protein
MSDQLEQLKKEISIELKHRAIQNGNSLPMVTHYEDCWKTHKGCLMSLAADLLSPEDW